MVSKVSKKPTPILYFGLNIEDQNHHTIKDILLTSLSEIQAKYHSTIEEIDAIKAYIKDPSGIKKASDSVWSFPKSFHVTTLFRGRKGFDKSKLSYSEFEEAKGVDLSIVGLIYIPKKIITLVVFTDKAVENKYPHLTGLVAGLKPNNSNDVCFALFDDNMHYADVYKEIKGKKPIALTDEFNESILGNQVTGYINLFEPKKVDANMKGFNS